MSDWVDPDVIAQAAVTAALEAVDQRVPDLRPGTVVESLGPTVMVRIDGSQPDDADLGRGVIPAQVLSDPPAVDQRVMVLFIPPAGAFVVGSYAGDRRKLGWAHTDVDQNGINGEVTLDNLEVEFVVTQPNRLVTVSCHIYVQGSTINRVAIVSAYDDDGNLLGEVARWPFIIAGSHGICDGELLVGEVGDAVDTGQHAWHLTLELTGGSGTVDAENSTQRATCAVWDRGPITSD